jgi:hypothetical protein
LVQPTVTPARSLDPKGYYPAPTKHTPQPKPWTDD